MSDTKTKAYLVRSEEGDRVVEAESFGRAIVVWRNAMMAEYGPDSGWDETSENQMKSSSSDIRFLHLKTA